MANRYWRGGSGTWNTTSTTNWSTTSGGAGGASVPTSSDSVFFDQAGTYTVTMTGALACLDFNVSAGAVTFATGTTPSLAIAGSVTITNVTPTWSSTGNITFNGASSKTITSNGVVFGGAVTFNQTGATWTLQDAFAASSGFTLTFTAGTINLNGNTLTCGRFSSNNTNARSIAFGNGNITLVSTGTVWNTSTATGFTTSGTQVVNVANSSATAATVAVGSFSEANSISFNFTTGTYALTLTGSCRNLDFTGFAGTVTSGTKTVYGDLTFSSGMSYSSTGTAPITFAATSGTKTITTNGVAIKQPLTFSGVNGSWVFADAVTLPPNSGLNGINLYNGSLDTNGYAVTADFLAFIPLSTISITLGASTVTLTGSGTPLNLRTSISWPLYTISAASSTINLTSASAKTAIVADKTWGTINQGGAGTLTLTGTGPTIGDITNTVQPATVLFQAGSTFNFSNFSLSGTSGNQLTIGSDTAGTQHTLSKASGTVDVNYCTISDSAATGGATWNALNVNGNIDGGNNSGWIFTGGTNYDITATNGSYAVTGYTATISRDKLLTAQRGTYSLTGQSATLTASRLLIVQAGSYAQTGQSIQVNTGRLLSAENGVYFISGQSAEITRGGGSIVGEQLIVKIRSFTERGRF